MTPLIWLTIEEDALPPRNRVLEPAPVAEMEFEIMSALGLVPAWLARIAPRPVVPVKLTDLETVSPAPVVAAPVKLRAPVFNCRAPLPGVALLLIAPKVPMESVPAFTFALPRKFELVVWSVTVP